MTYEEKKGKLGRYLVAVSKLGARCREAEIWEPFAAGGGVVGRIGRGRGGSAGLEAITETAETIQQEIERLAGEVNRLRRELTDAIGRVPQERYRNMLDLVYISGLDIAKAAEQLKYTPRYGSQLLAQAVAALDEYSNYFASEKF